jgi:hypothetical protein
MRRALLSTTALALSLLVAGAGAATASADALSPSPSPSVSDAPAPDLDKSEPQSESPSPSPSPSIPSTAPSDAPEDDTAALEPTLGLAPDFTCDDDPSDDFQIPEDGDGVTYTLEGGIFTATLDEGYMWGEGPVNWDPWTDRIFEEPPYLQPEPEPGTTEPFVRAVADYAFPNCNHNDETTVTVSTECTNGTGYLVYDVDAWWATDKTTVSIYPYTRDEAAQGHVVYSGNELSGRLAWDGSTPGMKSPIGPIGSGVNLPDVSDPIFSIRTGSGEDAHQALAMLDFEADDPCVGVDPSDPGDDGDDNAAGGDDDELAATGPEAAWLTAGAAALLVAVGTTLVVVRRRMSA